MSGIKLSIGMIVKNEEKYLRKCLESLRPIMENISSELVIVDTGSTDKTVEIAKEYTDKIYFFEWVNDFSAARNYGLMQCVGEWFMYTDADTIFETTEENMREIIEFFKNDDLNKNFSCATYTTRNYYDPSCKDYFEHIELRIARRTPLLRFIYPIHEVFNIPNKGACILNTYAHHHGYAFLNLAKANEKSRRNCELLKKELDKNPKDIRTQCLLFDSTMEHEEKAKIIEKAMQQAKTSNDSYGPNAFFRAARYYAEFDNTKAEKAAKEYISRVGEDDATLIEIYYKLGKIADTLNDFERARCYFLKCYRLQKAFEKGEADIQRLAYCALSCIGETAKAETFRHITFCMVNLGMTDEAFELWEKEYTGLTYSHAISILREIIKFSNNYTFIGGIYERMLGDNPEKAKSFEMYLESQYFTVADRAAFVGELSKGSNDFAALMRLVKLSGTDGFAREFEDMTRNFKWRDGFSELLYLVLKNDIDVRTVIHLMNFETMRSFIGKISANHRDFAQLVYEKCKLSDFVNSMSEVVWLTFAYESIVFGANMKPNENIRLGIYKNYAEILIIYVSNLYNPNLLCDSDINALPEIHRFGYYMIKAQKRLLEGDRVGYVRGLKTALLSCECAKDIVMALMDDVV